MQLAYHLLQPQQHLPGQIIALPLLPELVHTIVALLVLVMQLPIPGCGLPPGISASGGSISGFPSTSGSYSVSFYASGPGGNSSTITRTINVANRYPSWTDNTVSTSMRQGVSYSDGVSANYTSYYTSSGTIPAGLSFNTSNGTFSGTPTSPGSTYTFAFQAIQC